MKKLLFIFTLLICAGAATAQPLSGKYTRDTKIQAADEQYDKNNWHDAITWYEQAYKEEKSQELAYKLGLCYLADRDYDKAERYFTSVDRKDKSNDYPDAQLRLAQTMKNNSKYDEAIKELENFISETEDMGLKNIAKNELKGAQMAKTLKAVENLKVTNLGADINVSQLDVSPIYGTTENEMYYASLRKGGPVEINGKEEAAIKIYKATKQGENFTSPVELGQQVNRQGFFTLCPSINAAGNIMYFNRMLYSGNLPMESKVYSSKQEGKDWGSASEVIGINGAYMVKHPAVGELFGKEVLFFASNMDGGQGGYDLYYATKRSDGSFDFPVSLGASINTPGNEETPFYQDGKLYFSSTGHPGIGGYDIYSSVWNGTSWSNPTNMGLMYNSPQDDKSFVAAKDGYSGFLVSNRPGAMLLKDENGGKTCCDDVYLFNIEKMKINLVTTVFDGKKALPGAKMQLVEMTGNVPGKTEAKSNDKANNFDYNLAFQTSYMIITTKDGYYPDTTYFTTNEYTKTATVDKKINLKVRPADPKYVLLKTKQAVKKGEAIRLNNIYYDYDDDKILPDAEGDLNYLANIMKNYPDVIIEVSSHTDSRGNDAYNQKLSQRRAESAVKYLVEKDGIARERLVAKGYGESVVLNRCINGVKDCTDEEHRFNRRTEFKIVGGATEKEVMIDKEEVKKWGDLTPDEKKAGIPISEEEYKKRMAAKNK
jgi:peptidoglycan-associated lipoprotein